MSKENILWIQINGTINDVFLHNGSSVDSIQERFSYNLINNQLMENSRKAKKIALNNGHIIKVFEEKSKVKGKVNWIIAGNLLATDEYGRGLAFTFYQADNLPSEFPNFLCELKSQLDKLPILNGKTLNFDEIREKFLQAHYYNPIKNAKMLAYHQDIKSLNSKIQRLLLPKKNFSYKRNNNMNYIERLGHRAGSQLVKNFSAVSPENGVMIGIGAALLSLPIILAIVFDCKDRKKKKEMREAYANLINSMYQMITPWLTPDIGSLMDKPNVMEWSLSDFMQNKDDWLGIILLTNGRKIKVRIGKELRIVITNSFDCIIDERDLSLEASNEEIVMAIKKLIQENADFPVIDKNYIEPFDMNLLRAATQSRFWYDWEKPNKQQLKYLDNDFAGVEDASISKVLAIHVQYVGVTNDRYIAVTEEQKHGNVVYNLVLVNMKNNRALYYVPISNTSASPYKMREALKALMEKAYAAQLKREREEQEQAIRDKIAREQQAEELERLRAENERLQRENESHANGYRNNGYTWQNTGSSWGR